MGKANYQRLGEFIEQVNVRNRNLSVTNLMGVSIEKRFIPSIANTIGTDLTPYKIVKPRQFAYGPVTSRNGNKITIALYNGDEDCIISQAYESFKVKDENRLLPEYLMMWAKRPEFDRYARYMSHGSVREIFSWEDMCNVMLPIPPIAEQRRIVSEYQTVERRIANNEALIQKLEETAQAIYHHTFVEGIDEEKLPEGWRMGTLKDFGKIVTGTTPSCEHPEYFGEDFMFVTPADYYNYEKYLLRTERGVSTEGSEKMGKRLIPKESLLVTCIGSNMGRICINESDCYTNQQINSIILDLPFYKDYLYYCIKSLKEALQGYAVGSSAVPLLNKSQFEMIEVIVPAETLLKSFSKLIEPLNQQIKILSKEITLLKGLLTLLTSKLA